MNNKDLYQLAIHIIADIDQIKNSIDIISQEVDSNHGGNILLRTDETVFCSYRYASVRPSAYVKFLNGELKELEKNLKVAEDKIKRSIN
jgi:hypothetical protein